MSASITNLPAEQLSRLQKELRRGEIVSWVIIPSLRSTLPAIAFLTIFGLAWMSFVLVWEGFALRIFHATFFTDAPPKGLRVLAVVFPLFGLPFIAVGFYLLRLPVASVRRLRSSIHAITNERVLLISAQETITIPADQIRSWRFQKSRLAGESLVLSLGTKRDDEEDGVEDLKVLDGLTNAAEAENALRRLTANRDER